MIAGADKWMALTVGMLAAAGEVAVSATWWQPVLVALLSGGSLAAVFGMVRWWITYRDGRENGIEAVLRDQAAIQNHLNMAISASGARRALVLRMSNGGGIPRRGACLYLTVAFEAVGGSGVPVIHDGWQKRRVGPDYMNMLLPVLENGSTEVLVESLTEGSELQASYQAGGIRKSLIFEVGQIGNEYFFVSLGYGGAGDMRVEGMDAVYGAVAAIRSLLKKGPSS